MLIKVYFINYTLIKVYTLISNYILIHFLFNVIRYINILISVKSAPRCGMAVPCTIYFINSFKFLLKMIVIIL